MADAINNKYPEHIMRTLRERRDLEPWDTSEDQYINAKTANEVFKDVLEWEGIINYENRIKRWIKDIYGVSL